MKLQLKGYMYEVGMVSIGWKGSLHFATDRSPIFLAAGWIHCGHLSNLADLDLTQVTSFVPAQRRR